MEAEITQVKRQPNPGKFHKPMPTDIVPLKEKYELLQRENIVSTKVRNADLIEDSDFESMMQRYATDEEVDRLTICDAFGISINTFERLIKLPKYAETWRAVKKARAELLLKRSLQVAYEPYRAIMDGESVPPHLIKAAQLLSNQCLSLAKVIDPELTQAQGSVTGGAPIQIQVNTGINIPDD